MQNTVIMKISTRYSDDNLNRTIHEITDIPLKPMLGGVGGVAHLITGHEKDRTCR